MTKTNEFGQLIEVDLALDSMRDSGHDLSTAVGEVVDNSIEARAQTVKIHTGFLKGKTKKITEMAFSDNGVGISPDILQHVLTLGFSTRYNQRSSLGRFGMGLKIASISHAQRIEIYTRQAGGAIYYTYIDLEEIRDHRQTHIEKRQEEGYPEQYRHLMCDGKGKEYPSGTLVIWSKIDRLVNQGRYSSSLDKKMADLLDFLARAYRYFLAQGIKLYLDDRQVLPYDPLFLLENPLVTEKVGDVRAEILEQKEIDIEGHKVTFLVTLCPEAFRMNRGDGGNRGQAKRFDFLHLGDNAGKVSIVRNGREIYFNIIPRLMPGGREDKDRFIGIEIRFPAQLDEYFQVRNVKRGAEPVDNLREEFRNFAQPLIKRARNKIAALWSETEKKNAAQDGEHRQAMDIAARADQTAPGGVAGLGQSDEEAKKILDEALRDTSLDPQAAPQEAEKKQQELLENPLSILSGSWPGKELFEVDHIQGHPIVKLNLRHPFSQEIYCRLKQAEKDEGASWSKEDLVELTAAAKTAIELLLMAYAKAESLNPAADEIYSSLRSYWGIFAGEYINILAIQSAYNVFQSPQNSRTRRHTYITLL